MIVVARGAYYDVFTDFAGNVLQGATVTFTGASGGTVYSAASGGTVLATVTTGPDGSINVFPDADRYIVDVELNGFSGLTKTVDVSGVTGPVITPGELGLIQDPDGASVPGAFVRFVLTAGLDELDDIQIVGAAQMGGVFDQFGVRVTGKAVRVRLDALGAIDDLLVVNI